MGKALQDHHHEPAETFSCPDFRGLPFMADAVVEIQGADQLFFHSQRNREHGADAGDSERQAGKTEGTGRVEIVDRDVRSPDQALNGRPGSDLLLNEFQAPAVVVGTGDRAQAIPVVHEHECGTVGTKNVRQRVKGALDEPG